MQPKFFKKLGYVLLHYFWGAWASGWNGAMSGMYGFIGISVGSSLDSANISPPSLHTLYWFFTVRFALDFLKYCKEHPLPESLSVPPPAKVPEITTKTS